MIFNSCPANNEINGDPDNCPILGTANRVQLPVFLSSLNPTSSCQGTAEGCRFINYGQAYYWRAKVWEQSSAIPPYSAWANYIDSHVTSTQNVYFPVLNNYDGTDSSGFADGKADDNDLNKNTYTYPWSHPAPVVAFNPQSPPSPGQPAYFTDSSQCFNDDGSSYACNSTLGVSPGSPSNSYDWNWGDGLNNDTIYNVSDSATAVTNVPYTYSQPKTYLVGLKLCDPLGCCTATSAVRVGTSNANKVPLWQEVSPFQAPS